MLDFLRLGTVLTMFVVMMGGGTVVGQEVDVGGRIYADYFYNVSSPDGAAQDLHGFTYRRLYLTADFRLSEDIEGRARLEANEGTAGPDGPIPYVKDLSLTWTYTGEHRAILGVTPPPAFERSEDVWGYRSLDKTILDLQGIVSSRDFGLRLDGPLTAGGAVRYAIMYANNSGVQPESDSHKRVYGRLEVHPAEQVVFVGGADYAGYPDQRDQGIRLSAFGGYTSDPLRIGLEGYWYDDETEERLGSSLFGRVQVVPAWELVARVDRGLVRRPEGASSETFFVAGVAYQPRPGVSLIPNVRLRSFDGESDPHTRARLTVEASF